MATHEVWHQDGKVFMCNDEDTFYLQEFANRDEVNSLIYYLSAARDACFSSTVEAVVAHAQSAMEQVLAQREEILRAFVAKHGVQPDEIEQVEMDIPNGKVWFVRHRESKEASNV